MRNPGRKEGTMRKIICDRCHKEITEKPVKVYLNRVDPKTGDFEETVGESLEEIDLCEECAKALAAKIKAFSCKTEELSGQNPAKKKIDKGKVMALRNAGWTIKAIAEEMSCSPQTICNVIKKAPEPEQQEGQSETI